MTVTLLHNPSAGSGSPTADELLSLLERHGFQPSYHSVKDEDIPAALARPGDIVVIGGGDGTVRQVCRQIHDLGLERPVLLLPLGTMNNVARCLGTYADPDHLIGSLSSMTPAPFHFLHLRTAGFDDVFFESAGIGVWATLLAMAEKDPARLSAIGGEGERPARDFSALASLAQEAEALEVEITADGQRLRDRYLLAEIMNIPAVGSHMHLGTEDSLLAGNVQLALVPENDRRALVEYFSMKAEGHEASFPGVHRNCSRRVEISAELGTFHIDDDAAVLEPRGRITVAVERAARPLQILRPHSP